MNIFRTLVSKSLLVSAMLNFSGKANTLIHGLDEDDTASWGHAHPHWISFQTVAAYNRAPVLKFENWYNFAHIDYIYPWYRHHPQYALVALNSHQRLVFFADFSVNSWSISMKFCKHSLVSIPALYNHDCGAKTVPEKPHTHTIHNTNNNANCKEQLKAALLQRLESHIKTSISPFKLETLNEESYNTQ